MFYTHFHQTNRAVFVRYVNKEGKRVSEWRNDCKPTLYIKSNKPTKYKSLYDDPIAPVKFDSIAEAREFIKQYEDVDGFSIFGNQYFSYDYIDNMFKGDIEFDEKQILTYIIDIETEIDGKFPNKDAAIEPINVLTIFDIKNEKITTWTYKPVVKKEINHGFPVEYRTFSNEYRMLEDFIGWFSCDYPDVLTGWHTAGFDIPFLINRIKRIMGEEFANKLSPVGRIREFQNKINGETEFEIIGIQHLDYLRLYKYFIPGERDFSLNAVSEELLGEKKLENPFDSFAEFYQKDWDRFVDYNIKDTILVYRLDKKLKLLNLNYTLTYLAKVNYSDTLGKTRAWDVYIQNNLKKNNIFVNVDKNSYNTDSDEPNGIMGGFVLEPRAGKYKWIVSFDANSLYPSIIRSLNISPETFLKYDDVPDELIQFYGRNMIEDLLNNKVDITELLKKHNLSMSANGYFYRNDKQGIIPHLVEKVYNLRVEKKNEMKKFLKLEQEETDKKKKKEYEDKAASLDAMQNAAKIFINSVYGAMACSYFRFFNERLAESVTATGQYFVRYTAKKTSIYIDSLSGKNDSLVYIDTDSNMFSLESLIEKYNKGNITDKSKMVELIDQICKKKISPKIDECCNDVAISLNSFENSFAVKREKICESGIWIAKKRYALMILDNEGLRLKEPKFYVTGLEIKRSSTPKLVKDALEKCIKIVLSGTESELKNYTSEFKKKFMEESLENISIPCGVNGLSKYNGKDKGVPQHVKAAILYNRMINERGISGKYAPITEGGKMKRLYLKIPNPCKSDVIGYNTKLPVEFGLHDYVDRNIMFEKTFIVPLERVTNAVGWNYKNFSNIESLF